MGASTDLEHLTLRDDETLIVRLKPDTTPAQAADLEEHLLAYGRPPGRVILLPPIAETVTRRREAAGRVTITWPAPKPGAAPGALSNWGVKVEDADTGEPILTAFKVSIVLGTDTGYEDALIEADITALIDEDGNLLGNGPRAFNHAARDDTADGPGFRTKVFRYLVAEMRVAEA